MSTRAGGNVFASRCLAFTIFACSVTLALPSFADESAGAGSLPQAAAAGQQPGAPAQNYQAPPMGYPPPGYPPPGYPPPGYPPGYAPEPPEVIEEPTAPVIAPNRPLRFRINYGMGYFNPSDVNAYLKSKVPSNAYAVQGFSDMVLLLAGEVSVAYYPIRYVGIRPNAVYLFSPKVITVSGGSTEGFWLHSMAPGLSLDFAWDEGKLPRLFASPGLSYQAAWFEGYSASGLGLTLALGAELSFGQARSKGLYLALVLRKAKLAINGRPVSDGTNSVAMNHLDFTSVLFCLGFQTGI